MILENVSKRKET